MNKRATKAMVCAVASALLISCSSYHADAARTVTMSLPAAGLGLTLGEGVSVAQIREDVKKRKGTVSEQKRNTGNTTDSSAVSGNDIAAKNTEEEGTQSTETAGSVETAGETEATVPLTETESETESSVPEETASENETQIVEAVEPIIKEPETQIPEEVLEEKEEQDILIIAQVNDYVNIRSTPSTDGEIVGKLYNNSVGTLIRSENGWYQIKSGSVEGYVKAEYFKTGEEAKRIADEVGNKIATVNTETLRVRSGPSLDDSVLGLVPGGEELTVVEEQDGFVKVSIEEGDGWVSLDYVEVSVEYVTAESIEEERARLEEEERAKEEARRAAQAAEEKLREEERKREEQQKAEEAAAEEAAQEEQVSGNDSEQVSDNEVSEEQPAETESTEEIQAPSVSSGSSLGQSVANFAVQFVGNPYKYGGTSLTNGADCSGFVMSVYQNFGVSLPHSSSADRRVGYAVGSLSEAQPGDLVCYSGHVAIYIGNGQIVHASTASTGIKISNANYRSILAIRRIF